MSTATFTTLLSVLSGVSAMGINCRGNICPPGDAAGSLINLKAIVDGISDRNRHFNAGQQIACTRSLCTFFQRGASGTAADASELLQRLLDHGCKKCGSAPTQPGNDVSEGELTVSVVLDPHCQGVC